MDYSGPYYYTLQLSGNENKRVISKKVHNGKVSKFKIPVTKDKTPKIYVLKHNKQLLWLP